MEFEEYAAMDASLSEIQRRMLDFIDEFVRMNGRPPTRHEIGMAMQIRATEHVDHHLSMLAKMGHITRTAGYLHVVHR